MKKKKKYLEFMKAQAKQPLVTMKYNVTDEFDFDDECDI